MIKSNTKRIDYKMQYDPEDVDIRLEHFTVEKIVELIEINKLEIVEENDLQRLPNLWDPKRKSLLIESLLIKLPLPIFYLDGSDRIWQVIDGLQRLTTLFQFISTKKDNTPFALEQLEYLHKEYDGYTFVKLPLSMRRRILDAGIEAYVINPGTPYPVKYNIFQRINTLGLPLKAQEVRNALYRGIPSTFTKVLANEESFKTATNNKVAIRRMDDREYATRFVAFQWFKSYYAGDMNDFLRRAMEEMAEVSKDEREYIRKLFIKTMDRAHQLLGSYSFYRIEKTNKPRGRGPNKAVFDTLSWNLSQLTDEEFETLQSKKESFYTGYVEFMNDNISFLNAVGHTTSSKPSVTNRFNELEEFIKKYL